MLSCLIDNPDFTGKIITNFNQGGVTSVEKIEKQNKPPKIAEKLKSFIERFFGHGNNCPR